MSGRAEIRCGLPRRRGVTCRAPLCTVEPSAARGRFLVKWPAANGNVSMQLIARDDRGASVVVWCPRHRHDVELPRGELVAAAIAARKRGSNVVRQIPP